jgi:hypothetical protein
MQCGISSSVTGRPIRRPGTRPEGIEDVVAVVGPDPVVIRPEETPSRRRA